MRNLNYKSLEDTGRKSFCDLVLGDDCLHMALKELPIKGKTAKQNFIDVKNVFFSMTPNDT
jgi:hypothetical protein